MRICVKDNSAYFGCQIIGKMKRGLIFFSMLLSGSFLLFFLVSCNNGRVKQAKTKQNVSIDTVTFHPGVIYPDVKCSGHPGESYALVLPENYQAGKQFPVIFFFDAHARGWLPVKRYRALADTFGFILVASNNSKNGLDAPQRNRIIYNFMADVEKRFSLDPQRVYTGGFSGGARIAAGIGLTNRGIAGTIGCAAGFPGLQHINNKQLAYVGIVGNTDFNYLEMKQLSEELETARWRHCLLVFDGHHQWPPLQTMKKAFLFLQTDAMRRHFIPVNDSTILYVKNLFEKERINAVRKKDLLLQLQIDRQAVAFLEGLTDINSYQKEIKNLLQDPGLKKILQQQVALSKEEQQWQQLYAEALGNKDAGWWKTALGHLAGMGKTAGTRAQKLMVRRLYNYLSLMAYLYADGSLKNHNTEAARKYLMIYQFVDPTNPEVYFLKAQRFAMTGQTQYVLPALQKAADNGFYDAKRMEKDPYFTGLQQNLQFKKILRQVKANPVKEE